MIVPICSIIWIWLCLWISPMSRTGPRSLDPPEPDRENAPFDRHRLCLCLHCLPTYIIIQMIQMIYDISSYIIIYLSFYTMQRFSQISAFLFPCDFHVISMGVCHSPQRHVATSTVGPCGPVGFNGKWWLPWISSGKSMFVFLNNLNLQ